MPLRHHCHVRRVTAGFARQRSPAPVACCTFCSHIRSFVHRPRSRHPSTFLLGGPIAGQSFPGQIPPPVASSASSSPPTLDDPPSLEYSTHSDAVYPAGMLRGGVLDLGESGKHGGSVRFRLSLVFCALSNDTVYSHPHPLPRSPLARRRCVCGCTCVSYGQQSHPRSRSPQVVLRVTRNSLPSLWRPKTPLSFARACHPCKASFEQ